MLITSLDTCPSCQADLKGVGPEGRCARCGFEYDEHTRVWRARRTWHHHVVAYGLIGLIAGLGLALAERLTGADVENDLLPVVTGLVVAAGGLLLHRALTGRLSDRFVALTPRGILVGTRPTAQLIPWKDVRLVTLRGRNPRVERHSTGTPAVLEDVFDTPEEIAAFRQATTASRERYTQAEADAPLE